MQIEGFTKEKHPVLGNVNSWIGDNGNVVYAPYRDAAPGAEGLKIKSEYRFKLENWDQSDSNKRIKVT